MPVLRDIIRRGTSTTTTSSDSRGAGGYAGGEVIDNSIISSIINSSSNSSNRSSSPGEPTPPIGVVLVTENGTVLANTDITAFPFSGYEFLVMLFQPFLFKSVYFVSAA